MQQIATLTLHRAGNVTQRFAKLMGDDLPPLTVTVARGADFRAVAEDLRHMAEVLDRQAKRAAGG